MRVLVIGSGGREHALCWKISQSPKLSQLFAAPGNAGMEEVAACVQLDVDNHPAVVDFCRVQGIELVIIGPEDPLVKGLADSLNNAGIACFGPSAKAAQLEGSKAFSKALMEKYDIPTAAYGVFKDRESAKQFIREQGFPIVIKADGLAAGKGVTIAQNHDEAMQAVDEALEGKFGAAGKKIVIEAFLEGEELSFFALIHGKDVVEIGSAQDHKTVGEGDTGPNTGGMGTYSPAPSATRDFHKKVMDTIVQPTADAMVAEGMPYHGVLFVGLMLTRKGPQVVEYNVRFGDPETQVLMPRIEGDFLECLHAAAEGRLEDCQLSLSQEAALCVVLASKGYPGPYRKGGEIRNLDKAGSMDGTIIFHAGTKRANGTLLANGGRVLGVTACGQTIAEAQTNAYRAVDMIDWDDGFCRRDIGWRALKHKAA